MKYESVGEVLDEIRRVAPIYRGVVLGGPNDEAVWDLAQFPLHPSQPTPGALAQHARPRDTLGFDYLERRWQHRYRELMDRALKALAATA
jgi:hypothetical protein